MSSWIPTTCFKKIMRLDKRIKAVYGGSSSGKTFNILTKLYQDAVNNPGERITVASNTLANLKRGAVRDLQVILTGLDLWDPNCWKKSEQIYYFHNGSFIEFIGLEDETKARGPRVDRLFIDEANRITYEVYNQLELRAGKEVLLSWNPSGAFWYNEHIRDKVDHDELVVNYTHNEALNEIELTKFETMKEAAQYSEYNANRWKVYGLGQWGQVSGACIKNFKTCDVDANGNFWYNGEPLEGYEPGDVGLDFGNNDPNAAVKIYNKENESFIFDEILYKNKMSLGEIFESLKEEKETIYADYAWPQTVKYLQDRGLNVRKCRKGPDSIKNGIDLINQKDIYVTSRSKNLIMEFETYRYKEDKNGDKVDGKYEGPDHLVDACRYVLKENTKTKFYIV